MTEREKFMYSVIGALSSLNAPIVFKGALVLKVLQEQTGNKSGLVRETQDIDGDWVGNKPSMEYLTNLMKKAVKIAGYNNVKVVAYREYSEGRSAGFRFINSVNDYEIATMDLSIRYNPFSSRLATIDGLSFNGQIITKTLADKIHVVTTRKICRRVKDLIDIYILSYIYNGSYKDIISIMDISGREVGKADTLLRHTDDVIHAYSRYNNSAANLDFSIICSRALIFLDPFLNPDKYKDCNLVWSIERGWLNV